MEGDAETCAISKLKQGRTPRIDDHQMHLDDVKAIGDLASDCA